jgi:CRISPR-associated protein Csd1
MTLYSAILTRVRAGEKINRIKAAIIKAVLIRNFKGGEVITVSLNTQSIDKPYVLGRLFSVLERTQMESAEVKLNRTIRDTYFFISFANPGSVFQLLMKLSVQHVRKLSDGSKIYYEKLKGELLNKIEFADAPAFPSAFNSEQQGRFILGYYHQTQYFYTPKKDREDIDNV